MKIILLAIRSLMRFRLYTVINVLWFGAKPGLCDHYQPVCL